ncbi:MAG: T9SS C-terminal target domain-containing protein [Cryomorphaceae bacterium]|nr:MAG: T9SS C-terminal target domain-containing protein [Cryomorphaceae bacterium]
MRIPLLMGLAVMTLSVTTSAQQDQNYTPCAHDHWLHHIRQHKPEKAAAIDEFYRYAVQKSQTSQRDDEVYTVPVVFHVVYNNAEQNLHDSVIHSQIEVLNEDYRRMNADADLTRDIFLPVAGDVGIEFQLAEVDPSGNPTDGIVRVETNRAGFSLDLFGAENTLDEVKFAATGGSDAWDTEHYLNIWVCNIEGGLFGQIFGLAYPPDGVPNWPDGAAEPSPDVSGVIVHFTTVGRNNPSADLDGVPYNNLGRTCTHEVGHYFGLRHTWGDALPLFGDGCAEDDGLDDTPNCFGPDNQACNYSANTCPEDPLPDMIENYMDYSRDNCMNIFTQQQVEIMRLALTEFRPGLIASPALSVRENPLDHTLKMYPNPAKEWLVIEQIGDIPVQRVEVYDALGRLINDHDRINLTRVELPLGALAPGNYLVRIHAGEHFTTRSLMKY